MNLGVKNAFLSSVEHEYKNADCIWLQGNIKEQVE